jgi:hypothetical protein
VAARNEYLSCPSEQTSLGSCGSVGPAVAGDHRDSRFASPDKQEAQSIEFGRQTLLSAESIRALANGGGLCIVVMTTWHEFSEMSAFDPKLPVTKTR